MREAMKPKGKNELRVGFQRKDQMPKRRPERKDETEEEAPKPGSFDPDAPLPKRHKETKEERMARRANEGGRGPTRRAKPGAALANAQRPARGLCRVPVQRSRSTSSPHNSQSPLHTCSDLEL